MVWLTTVQFHLDGFRPGDPAIAHSEVRRDGADRLHRDVDVLIVGAGPTGLTLAAQLAAFPEIDVLVAEQKPGPLELGQADGIACRTLETFEALGFSERVLKEAYWVNETTFWKPDEHDRHTIVRSGRIQDTEDGLSEFPHVILNQARVHDFLLDVMRRSPSRLEPAYSRRLLDLQIDVAAAYDDAEHSSSHPVTASFEYTGSDGEVRAETVRARYAVGCDGARSTVRRCIGRPLHGDSANQSWGVMDVLAVTDFPDIRLKSAIHSAKDGNLLIIPREGGYLVRIYIELEKLNENERIKNRNLTIEHLVAAAKRIVEPYTLEVKEVVWWSVYEIGQRLCEKFDDVPAEDVERRRPLVFIAGDACHTHSPKAGQGMNVSIADAFNLGWKLASVLRGTSSPRILHTYSDERRALAKELIEFDREFAQMFSAPPKDPLNPSGGGVDPLDFQRYFVRQGRFTAGTAVRYGPSPITAASPHQHLAAGFVVGTRFHSAPVIRLADAKRVHLGHTIKADGRWRLFVFAPDGEALSRLSAMDTLCSYLTESPDSPIRSYTPPEGDVDAVIDVRAILPQHHRDVDVRELPPLLLPRKGRYGLRDYEKVFCADLAGDQDIFELRGVDRRSGCIVVVRPDQFVADIRPLEDHSGRASFFAGFMTSQRASR